MKPGRVHRTVLSVGVGLALLGIAGQFVVPRIATAVLRQRLSRNGRVLSVQVSAFPWVQLLWKHADTVSARLADYRATPNQLQQLLHQGGSAGTVEVSVGTLRVGPLTLHDVHLDKHGDEMVGAASLELKDLRSALPFVRSLTPVQDANGQFVLRGTAGVLGVNATVDVVVAARDGKLVVAPSGLLGAFAAITLYDDPHLRVQSVSATKVPGGVRFSTRGKLA